MAGATDTEREIKKSKEVLKGAEEFQRRAGGPLPKDEKPTETTPPSPPPAKPASSSIAAQAATTAQGLAERRKNVEQYKAAYPSFKKGGDVKKTGTYKLHEGEKVIPKKHGKIVIHPSGHKG